MTTTTTQAAETLAARVTLGELADAAKVIRKSTPDRRRRMTDAPLLYDHVVITPRNIVGGDPNGVMVSMAGGTLVVPDHPHAYDYGAIAVPFDVITEASKRARKLSATIRRGALEREDGATFTWRDPHGDAYAFAWSALQDAFGEPLGASALSARFAVGEYMTAIGAVLPAVSRDESRPVLCNVMMRTPNYVTSGEWAELEVAATDSYRLHVATVRAHVETSDTSPVLIPAKAAQITTMVKGADIVDVDAREDDAKRVHVTLRGPGAYPTGAAHPDYMMRVSFPREDGQYPNVCALYPTHDVSGVACVDAAQAADVMMTARGVAKAHGARGAETVILYAEPGGGALRVSVRESDTAPGGEWQVPALVSAHPQASPEDGEVGANGGFVADAFRSVATTAADAVITFHGALRPMLIAQAEADAATAPVGLWCVVMPIRI